MCKEFSFIITIFTFNENAWAVTRPPVSCPPCQYSCPMTLNYLMMSHDMYDMTHSPDFRHTPRFQTHRQITLRPSPPLQSREIMHLLVSICAFLIILCVMRLVFLQYMKLSKALFKWMIPSTYDKSIRSDLTPSSDIKLTVSLRLHEFPVFCDEEISSVKGI